MAAADGQAKRQAARAQRRARRAGRKSAGRRAGPAEPRHLLDHLSVVRQHLWLAMMVAGAVFGVLVWRTFQKPPVYAAEALLFLDGSEGLAEGAVVAPMMAFDQFGGLEAEVAVLSSYSLARELAADPASPARLMVQQTDAYDPWDAFLRQFQGGDGVSHIVAECCTRDLGSFRGTLRFLTDVDGRRVVRFEERDQAGRELGAARDIENFAFAEPYTDTNGNARYDAPEPWRDLDGNVVWTAPEPFTDLNGNGKWDAAEAFTDTDGDGELDPHEPRVDEDGDGFWRRFAEPYEDLNGNGRYDAGDPFEDVNANFEWDPGEPFVDQNGNGKRDVGTPVTVRGAEMTFVLQEGDPWGHVFEVRAPGIERAARLIHESVVAGSHRGRSGLVSLVGRAPTPHFARDVVNALVRTYLSRKQLQKEERAERLLSWLRREMARVDRTLRFAQLQRDEFVRREGAVLLSERAQVAYAEEGALVRERLSHEFEVRRLQHMLEALTARASDEEVLTLLSGSHVDPQTAALLSRLTALQADFAAIATELKADSSEFKLAEARTLETNRLLRLSVERLVAERRAQFAADLANVKARLEQVVAEETKQRVLMKDLPRLEQQRIEVNRPVLELEQARSELARWLKDTEVAKASSVSTARLIDPARLNPARVGPNLWRDAIVALVAALAAGVAVSFLLEYLDRRLKKPSDVQAALGLPIYAAVPAFGSVRRRDRARRGRPLVAVDRPRSVLAEAYRSLRSGVRHENRDRPVRTLAITSPTQAEGKSITTTNLAATMALAGERVLVVDTDLRRPSTHVYAQNERVPGLAEVIAGQPWREVVRVGGVPGLSYIHAGAEVANPGAVLESAHFLALVDEWADQFDIVLFDVPPVLAVADASSFLHRLDAVLLLVHDRRYPLQLAEDAYEQLVRAGADVRGLVYNGFDVRRASRGGYGYGYGYYGYGRTGRRGYGYR